MYTEPRDDARVQYNTQQPTPSHHTSPIPDNAWNQQRQLLLQMLEKNQQITLQAQNSWAKQKEDLEKHYSFIEQSLKKQLTHAMQEKTALRSELANFKTKGGVQGGSRIELLKQLQRVDFAAQERQADLIQQIKSLKAQLNTLQASVGTNKNRAQEEKQYLQTQIEMARTDGRRMQADAQRNIDDLTAKYQRNIKQLQLKNQDLEKAKSQFEKKFNSIVNQRTSEVEDTKIHEQKSFLHQSTKVAKLIQDKKKLMFIQIQEFEQQKKNIQTFYQDKLNYSNAQIWLLESKLEESTESAKKREDTLNKEVVRLRNSNTRLHQLSQQRQGILQKDLQSLKAHLKKVQNQYQQRQATYFMESAQHIQQITTYQQLLKQFDQQNLKITPVNQALQQEVQTLQQQIRQKDEQINNLRDLYINREHSQRRMITKTISSAQSLLVDINKQQNLLMKEENTYSANLRQLEQQASQKQKQQSQAIQDLYSKLQNLRKEYEDYKSNQWEEQLQTQLQKQEQLQQDLDQARNNLVNYVMRVKKFEDEIERRNKQEDEAKQTDMIRSLQLEIERLNAQNSSLVENRSTLQHYFTQQVQKLQSFLQKKNYQLAQLYSKSDRARNNKAKKHLQQIASWQNRQLAFTKTIKNLESQVKALSNQAVSRKHLSQHQASLEIEELNLLRNQVSAKQEWIDQKQQIWEGEKQSLLQQITRLNGLVQSFSEEQDTTVKHMCEQHDLLKTHRQKLMETISSVNQQMDVLTSNSSLTSKYDQNQQKVLESSYNEIAEIIRQEAEALKQQLGFQRETHRQELKNLKTTSSKEIRILKDIEEALNKHIQAQQEELDKLTQALADQKTQHSEDLENLRSELHALRRVNSKKHLLMHNENVSLTGEINRLLSLVQRREQSGQLQQKIQQIEMNIDQRVLNYDKNKMELEEELFKSVDQEIADVIKQLKDLRDMDEERDKHRQQEKQAMHSVILNLRRSVQIVQDSAQAESESIAVDLELAMKKLKLASSEKEALKQQRDKLLQTLSKSRSLSKSDRNTVGKLIDQLKTHPSKR